jgi:hypothetical protein
VTALLDAPALVFSNRHRSNFALVAVTDTCVPADRAPLKSMLVKIWCAPETVQSAVVQVSDGPAVAPESASRSPAAAENPRHQLGAVVRATPLKSRLVVVFA